MPSYSILVIDDDRPTRTLLGRALEREGFAVTLSADGREALQIIESERPALIVSDYEMPEFNGAEVCELIRGHSDPAIAELPIILLTAHSGEDHEVECLKAGANDFVSKPVNTAVLAARIQTHLRLHGLRAELQQQNAELERGRAIRERDLEAAQITQQAILPAKRPSIPGWDLAAIFQPVIQVGGDMYDWVRLSDGEWLVWIADATGHGASAALLTTLAKLVFRHAAAEVEPSPRAFLKHVNAEFHSVLRGKSFMTAACLILVPNSGKVQFAGAGHPPLLIRRSSGETEFLNSTAPPIGIVPLLECGECECDLASGDSILLYTDGLYSIERAEGERMEPEDVAEMVPLVAMSAEGFVQAIAAEFGRRSGGNAPDDLAAIAIRKL